MFNDETLDTLRRLKEQTQRQQDWVWEVAKLLHDAGFETSLSFKHALNSRDWTNYEPCEACGALGTLYPADHARHIDQGYSCPLGELDDPAYTAHCILTEPEGSDAHRENLMHP